MLMVEVEKIAGNMKFYTKCKFWLILIVKIEKIAGSMKFSAKCKFWLILMVEVEKIAGSVKFSTKCKFWLWIDGDGRGNVRALVSCRTRAFSQPSSSIFIEKMVLSVKFWTSKVRWYALSWLLPKLILRPSRRIYALLKVRTITFQRIWNKFDNSGFKNSLYSIIYIIESYFTCYISSTIVLV